MIRILAATETWATAINADAEFAINNFILFRGDRGAPAPGGGAMLFVHHSLMPTIPLNCPPHPDAVTCVCILPNSRRLLICCAYRSPSNSPATNIALMQYLQQLSTFPADDILLLGDFNYPDIDWFQPRWPPACNDFMDTIFTLGLSQFVFEATRLQNVLDLVFCTSNIVSDLTVEAGLGRSDHYAVHFRLSVGRGFLPPAPPRRIWGRADWAAISNHISAHPALPDAQPSAEARWDDLRGCILDAVSLHVPVATGAADRRPAWADYRCWAAIKAHKNAHKAHRRYNTHRTWTVYRSKADCADIEVRRAKRKYLNSLAENINRKPKLFWRHVNGKIKHREAFARVTDSAGNLTSSALQTSEALNSYFSSVFRVEDVTNLPAVAPLTNDCLSNIHISPVTVSNTLRYLKLGSSPGPDGIPNRLLANCRLALARPLAALFTQSLQSSQIPSEWLKANVIAIHKKGSRRDCSNYRPISLTPSICKALERIVRDEMVSFIDERGLLRGSQYGFRTKRSTTMQLIDYFHAATGYVDEEGACVDTVLLDLRKAFDLVPHERLLLKLSAHGIGGLVHAWVTAFLSGRTQSVCVDGAVSSSCAVTSGVPQGSVIGPLLFLLYINDLEDGMGSHVWKFADDTSLLHPLRTPFAVDAHRLQCDLDTASSWAERWGMEFGIAKCAVLHFGYGNPGHIYTLCGQALQAPGEERYLGLILSDSLKPSAHCQRVAAAAHLKLNLLFRCFGLLHIRPFLLIYRGLIRPGLEYASEAWSPSQQGDIDVVERVQRRATRMVVGMLGLSYEDRLRSLSLQTLQTRRRRADLILTFKLLHNLVDYDYRNLLTLSATTNLRGHSLKLEKIRGRLNLRIHSFPFRIVSPWNGLPESVVSAPSITAFKNRLHLSGALGEL